MTTQLRLLNLFRWLKENAAIWGLLTLLYSFALALAVEPILESLLKRELELGMVWVSVSLVLLIPSLLEVLPLSELPLPRGFGLLSPSPTLRRIGKLGGPLGGIYLAHEIRRSVFWLTLALSIALGCLLSLRAPGLWLIAAQLPAQRALYSIHRWHRFAVQVYPQQGGVALIKAFALVRAIELALIFVAAIVSGTLPIQNWAALFFGMLAASFATSVTSLEGDAGRPYLVNLITFAIAILAGYLSYWSPWVLAIVVYFGVQHAGLTRTRLKSVESLDEDSIIP